MPCPLLLHRPDSEVSLGKVYPVTFVFGGIVHKCLRKPSFVQRYLDLTSDFWELAIWWRARTINYIITVRKFYHCGGTQRESFRGRRGLLLLRAWRKSLRPHGKYDLNILVKWKRHFAIWGLVWQVEFCQGETGNGEGMFQGRKEHLGHKTKWPLEGLKRARGCLIQFRKAEWPSVFV